MGRTERSFKGCETANAILRSFSKLSVGEGGGGSRGTKERRDSPLFLDDGVVDRGGVEPNREYRYPSAGWNAIGRLAGGAGGSCAVAGVEGGNGEGTVNLSPVCGVAARIAAGLWSLWRGEVRCVLWEGESLDGVCKRWVFGLGCSRFNARKPTVSFETYVTIYASLFLFK